MNSVHEALAHAVPMVLTPRSREQRTTAARVAELGAGVWLPSPGQVHAAVTRVAADPVIRAGVQALSARVRAMPSVAIAATAILRRATGSGLTAACRPTGPASPAC
jgi:UDP:flavonoid glycosyltransferase YjiC (YdhE family)